MMQEQPADLTAMPVIMYVINSFNGGGAEAGLVTIVRGGVFAGSRLRIVALVRGNGEAEAHLRQAGYEPQILVDRTHMRSADIPLLYQRLRKLVREVQPHIVIASLPQANLLARMSVMRRKDILFVSFEHNSHLAKRAYEICYRLTSHRVDWVFADARSTLETVLRRLYRTAPVRQSVVPLVSFAARTGCTGKLASNGAFHIVNAARFTAVKNQAALIEAVASLHEDVILTLYGDGPTLAACKALAAQLGIAECVRFPGFVANWASYPADLFVLASRHEGLCIVVLEAMNAGIPVAAPLIGGLRDYLEPGLVRELRTVHSREIADVIVAARNDRDGSASMASRAFQMVDRRFGADVVRAMYGQVNRALIAAASEPQGIDAATRSTASRPSDRQ